MSPGPPGHNGDVMVIYAAMCDALNMAADVYLRLQAAFYAKGRSRSNTHFALQRSPLCQQATTGDVMVMPRPGMLYSCTAQLSPGPPGHNGDVMVMHATMCDALNMAAEVYFRLQAAFYAKARSR